MVYVLSDIHGNTDRYRSIMEQINLQPDDTLYILGDVIDRYPGGIDLLLEIMEADNIKMLLGNHEYMMLCALGETKYLTDKKPRYYNVRDYISLWYRNQGQVTKEAFDQLTPCAQMCVLEFLRDLPINIDIEVGGKRYKLVHASPLTKYSRYIHSNKFSSEYADKTEFAVWERIARNDTPPRNYTLIFGHTPTLYYQICEPLRIYRRPHMIGIDCGSGYSEYQLKGGRLACLCLDDMQEFYSEY